MKGSVLLASALVACAALADTSRSVTLAVARMDCAACPITVRVALEKVPGVKSAKVDFAKKTAVVIYDPARAAPQALIKASTDAGYPATLQAQR